jgi:hypothetical protein
MRESERLKREDQLLTLIAMHTGDPMKLQQSIVAELDQSPKSSAFNALVARAHEQEIEREVKGQPKPNATPEFAAARAQIAAAKAELGVA